METHKTCSICDGGNLSSKSCKDNALFAETLNTFMSHIGVPHLDKPSKLRLCDECYSGVMKAVEWREKVDDVEKDVRSLQRIILKMMRQLKSFQGSYLDELRDLEWKIQKFKERSVEESGRVNMREKNLIIDDKYCFVHAGDTLKQGILDVISELGGSEHVLLTATEWGGDKVSISSSENCTQNQDPVFTENFDIEYEVYSESLTKREPIPVEEEEGSLDNINLAIPVEMASEASPLSSHSSSSSASRKMKTKKTSKFKNWRTSPCKHCGKTFSDAWKLRRHVYTHSGERPHMCHLCPMTFQQNHQLRRHLIGHSGEKPFICPQCKKGFSHKDSLEKHKRTHSEEKPFICLQCKKGFSCKELLKRHKKRHSGEKPFSCNVCGKKFTARQSVKRHYKTEHQID